MKSNQTPKKSGKQDKSSSNVMRFFYIFMLLLLLSSTIIRFAGAKRPSDSAATPTAQVNPVPGRETSARAFAFHSEASSGACTDLVIPVKGNVVYNNCGNGVEKQYDLSTPERKQLEQWIAAFQPVNYNKTTPSQEGDVKNQLYLNGTGSQAASDADIQSMLQFAQTLAAKIESQP